MLADLNMLEDRRMEGNNEVRFIVYGGTGFAS